MGVSNLAGVSPSRGVTRTAGLIGDLCPELVDIVQPFASVLIGGPAFSTYNLTTVKVVVKRRYNWTFEVTDYSGTGTVGKLTAGTTIISGSGTISGNGILSMVVEGNADEEDFKLFTRSTNQCTFSNISIKCIS